MQIPMATFISKQCRMFYTSGIVSVTIVLTNLHVLRKNILAIHNVVGLCLGTGVAKLFKLDEKKVTAIGIEVGMQNSGLAISLATANFALNPLATLPGAIFSV